MSDSEDSDNKQFGQRSLEEIHNEIERCKRNPETAGMFVSGWDDADQDVELVKDPEANSADKILWAAENGEDLVLLHMLTTQPELVHTSDGDGYTPLHRASYGNHVKCINVLLKYNANVGARTEMGWTPLHSACNWNNYLAAARLLAAGADPTAVSDGEQTPLHLASAISHCKSTLLILLLREDITDIINKKNNANETPEELARGHGKYAPLFEMALPAASYIKSLTFTCNPYIRGDMMKK